MRTGIRLGIDVGQARIGVARSDAHGIMAFPVETVIAGPDAIGRIIQIIAEHEAMECLVGLPINLSGKHTIATEQAIDFARLLAAATDVQVRLVDERLSTVTANYQLRQAGRNTKQSRSVIDQAAAVVILQNGLDTERNSGNPAGNLVELEES